MEYTVPISLSENNVDYLLKISKIKNKNTGSMGRILQGFKYHKKSDKTVFSAFESSGIERWGFHYNTVSLKLLMVNYFVYFYIATGILRTKYIAFNKIA